MTDLNMLLSCFREKMPEFGSSVGTTKGFLFTRITSTVLTGRGREKSAARSGPGPVRGEAVHPAGSAAPSGVPGW